MVASAPRMVTVKTGNLYESTVHIPFDDVIDSVKLWTNGEPPCILISHQINEEWQYVIIPGLPQSHNRNHHMWRRHIGKVRLLPFMSTTDEIWKSWRVVTFHRRTVQLLSLVTLFWGDKGTLENSTGIEIGKGDWATVSAGGSAASQILFGIGVVSTKLFGQSDIKDSGWVPGSTDPPRSLY